MYEQSELDLILTRPPTKEYLVNGENVQDSDYRILDTPELRAEYVRLTDRLIAKTVEDGTDTIIFLDKSARPLAWLMKELWPVIGPRDDDDKLLDVPEIKFLNIDREQWGAIIGRSEDKYGGIDIDRIPDERLDELRSVFTVESVEPENSKGKPTIFDGKRVMVVDEVRASGDTLTISNRIIQKTFPDMESLVGFHWMGGDIKYDRKSGGKKVTKLPVWYSDRDKTGRAVADRDTTKSANSPSIRQRRGAYWLSTLFREGIDEKGLILRKECALLAKEVAEHRLPYIPGPIWDTDLMIDRIERFNGLSISDYKKLREQAGVENSSFVKVYRDFRQARIDSIEA